MPAFMTRENLKIKEKARSPVESAEPAPVVTTQSGLKLTHEGEKKERRKHRHRSHNHSHKSRRRCGGEGGIATEITKKDLDSWLDDDDDDDDEAEVVTEKKK